MQKLLDQIEQAGFRDEDGQLLTNTIAWHELRRRINEMHAWAIEAKKAIDLLTERVEGAKL